MDTDEATLPDAPLDPHDHAIPVTVVRNPVEQKSAPADLASWRTIIVAATDAPTPILAQDPKRHRAVIVASGVAANSCLLGRQKQASNAQGFTLVVGMAFVYEAASEVWLIPTGQAITLSILEERYL